MSPRALWRRWWAAWRAPGGAEEHAPRPVHRLPALGPAPDPLGDALIRLRRTVDEGRWEDLPLAWFRVDEAKAAAAWYDVGHEPPPAVLPEEQALAERLARGAGSDDGQAMVRYRLLVAQLPALVAAGGRRASEALRTGYELMARAPDVLSPYGRWLLAAAVCRAARDHEELARQTERFRMVTADHRATDGASMAFVPGGEFRLPLPLAVTDLLDLPGMPTRQEALKRDAPRHITRAFLGLTERSRRIFLRAFMRREAAYHNGYPWRKPPWLASEGIVFVRVPVILPAFFIDRRPVDQAMFAAFVAAQALWRPSQAPPYAVDRASYLRDWRDDRPPADALSEPVTSVSYQACRAYLAAAGKLLPTEAQWVWALLGPDVPETRQAGPETRPTMTSDDRGLPVRKAAERGLHLLLPERVYDFDGCCPLLPWDPDRVLSDPHGPATGAAHVWRSPSARGRVSDRAGEPALTFRGVVPASRLWAGGR